jgi:hypothetical protein
MMFFRLLMFLFLIIFTLSCSKEKTECKNSVSATLRYLQVGGQCWIFELEDNSRFEIIEWPDEGYKPINGKKVRLVYTTEGIENFGSVCMMGPLARIVCIKELEVDKD